jgi:uncharacterized membrane protein
LVPNEGAVWHTNRRLTLTGFSLLDWITLIFFGLAWFGYEFVVDSTAVRHRSLNRTIDEERHHWMQEMALVDNRIMDSNLHASLQNGTAFFASTALLAVGAALTLLRATDDVLTILARCPLGSPRAGSPGRSRSRAS